MTISKSYINHSGIAVPEIQGAKDGKGGGKVAPNSLFSTDMLFLTTAIGEGPVYRINPNGPQDIQIQDSSIDDLININTDGKENTDYFITATRYGTVTQSPIPVFGDAIVSPQGFASPVSLRKGNLTNIPRSAIDSQQTSAAGWDAIRFVLSVDQLSISDNKGNVNPHTVDIRIAVFKRDGTTKISDNIYTIKGKTDKPVRREIEVLISTDLRDEAGYVFTIEKITEDSDDSKIADYVSVVAWFEIENTKQAYPRTALIGYGLKAVNEHTGGIPTFTSMTKGLLVKVPSNYNQPVLSGTIYPGRDGEIDWREIETPASGANSYITNGYTLQKPGTGSVLYAANPQIYIGTWDGSFVYSWTQNPVWILYDILTNQSYGLNIPVENIDKYKFYQVAQYCDACDPITGKFMGVDGLADGSYRYKPRGTYTRVRENQLGLPDSTPIKERRFISDISITDQEKGMDLLNKIAATFRGMLVYSAGKITIAIDMPNEYPAMLFNEATIKSGSFQISGTKESDIYTGVDVTYIEPTNHFKRETVRINTADSNDGTDTSDIENIATLDLFGVTRRSQAVRTAQYQIAASRYQRRNITFVTGTDALSLTPGDVISIATQGTGVAYGFGGKVVADSAVANTTNTKVYLEHFTVPSLSAEVFTNNTYPLSLRLINQASDRMEVYIVSNTDFSVTNSGNVSSGTDLAEVTVLSKFNRNTKQFVSIDSTGFTANLAPKAGDLWSLGELQNPGNYYSNKSGKLFKVTNLKRDSDSEEVTVNAVEYISNVYEDSDTFINYQPTSYTDIVSPFAPPPAPDFTFTAVPRRKIDGTVVVDGVISTNSERSGYGQKFETEYYVSTPTTMSLVANVTATTPLTFIVANTAVLQNKSKVTLVGKNGFTTPIGKIKLLCTQVDTPTGSISFTVPGLSSCIDKNFNVNVLDVIGTGLVTSYGANRVVVPVRQKNPSQAKKNFIGYSSDITEFAVDITSYDTVNDTITIQNKAASGSVLASALPPTPFYISINQVLDPTNYSNNTFYVNGTEYTYSKAGSLLGAQQNTITLDITPRDIAFVRLYVDGVEKNTNAYTLNMNSGLTIPANIVYTAHTEESAYMLEVDHYTVPSIEVGDTLEIGYANSFVVTKTSYTVDTGAYNSTLTNQHIYRVTLDTAPSFALSGYRFINTTENPVGTMNNVTSTTFTLDYDKNKYPGVFNLSNNKIYAVERDSTYSRYFLADENKIPELPIGLTSVKARNKNTIGRVSPYVTQSIQVGALPIQKVTGLELIESLYIEQTGGVSVRLTVVFDNIKDQEVTDYEISYKITTDTADSSSGSLFNTNGYELTEFNTIKIAAAGEDSAGKLRYTINNINRGAVGSSSITVRVTPLNKSIRGITAEKTQSIVGKTAAPKNVINFTGGQQNELVTLFWSYERDSSGQLYDLDLKEVDIRRLPGTAAINKESFIRADPVVTVSAGSGRKSIPIDSYGEFTYLAVTRDTSGNISENVVGVTISTTRAQRSTIVAAYNEDTPSEAFTLLSTNDNSTEVNFPSTTSTKGGLRRPNGTKVDNANGTASGWSALANPTDLKAATNATYITQIRDFGQTVTGTISLFISATQEVQHTYNDQYSTVLTGISDTNTRANILIDTGIGSILGFANAAVSNPRYDTVNQTWMTGSSSGNVWAIWSPGINSTDVANANSYALIAGVINANAIALGATFYANGKATGDNALANVTTVPSPYALVNLKQYVDDSSATYVGDIGVVSSQTFIRTCIENPYYANGNVNLSVFSSSSDGYIPYEAGTRTFRYMQIKYVVTNKEPDKYDFTLDKFRYTIDKEQTIYTTTTTYTSAPQTIDFSSAKFITRPVINFTILSQTDAVANPAIAVTTAASNTSVSFRLVASNGTGAYPTNGTATVMVTATGV